MTGTRSTETTAAPPSRDASAGGPRQPDTVHVPDLDPFDSVPAGDLEGVPHLALDLPRRPIQQPRAVLAGVQLAGARTRRGPSATTARTGQVPRHLRQQPRRVLHGAHRRAEASRGDGPAGAVGRRALTDRDPRRSSPSAPANSPTGTPTASSTTSSPTSPSTESASCAGVRSTRRSASAWAATSARRCSRCSPRWRSTRRTRSRTSPACR